MSCEHDPICAIPAANFQNPSSARRCEWHELRYMPLGFVAERPIPPVEVPSLLASIDKLSSARRHVPEGAHRLQRRMTPLTIRFMSHACPLLTPSAARRLV